MFETLFAKVAILLTISLLVGAVGTYVGREIRGIGAAIGLGIAFIAGVFVVMGLAHASTGAGITALFIWVFISGLFIGPCIQMYVEKLGWETVFLAYLGTGGAMAICGAISLLSNIDFSGLGPILGISLLGLIVVGIAGIFVRFSKTVNIVHSVLGMIVFTGYFLFDFYRLKVEEPTWENAINLTMNLYLDFMNFLLYLLDLILESQSESASIGNGVQFCCDTFSQLSSLFC